MLMAYTCYIETDIQTLTPKTKISPSQQYRHLRRDQCTTDSNADSLPPVCGDRNNHAADESDGESESGMFNRTLQHSYEVAPSSSDLSEIERKLDMWSRQLNSNIMVSILSASEHKYICFTKILMHF